MTSSLLDGLQVVDLSGRHGYLCGKTLADMGADVILVEPPGGSEGRRVAPFAAGVPAIESSLSFWAQNSNKRGITLDFSTRSGADLLEQLLSGADILIEDARPGQLASLGFGFSQVIERFPALVYVSISPYGQTGPYSQYLATDLVLQGMGTHMMVTGDRDRPPCRISVPVSHYHAGVEGAAGAMIALYHRDRSGEGQHVDVSMQACIIWTLLNTTMSWQLVEREEERGGAVRKERAATVFTRLVWECQDGLVHFVPVGGGGGISRSRSYERLVAWMEQEGFGDPVLRSKDWNGADLHRFTQAEYDQLAVVIDRFLRTKTVAALYDRAVTDKLLLAPIATVTNIVNSPQLIAREFLVSLHHDGLGREVPMPGPFAKLSRTPLVPPGRSPRLGEHNEQVYGELGFDDHDLDHLRHASVI